VPAPEKPVSRADIEAKLAEIRGGRRRHHRDGRRWLRRPVSSVAGVGVVIVAFLLGPSPRSQEEHHRRSPAPLMASARRDALIAVGAAASAARCCAKDFTSRFTARIGSAALRRGMHSGNRAWFYVAAGATGVRLLHKYAGRKEEVFAIKLAAGATRSRFARSLARSRPVAFRG